MAAMSARLSTVAHTATLASESWIYIHFLIFQDTSIQHCCAHDSKDDHQARTACAESAL